MTLAPLLILLAAASPTATICTSVLPGEGERNAGIDDDRDGIPDSDDWCALSPAGTRVAPNGCADWEVPVVCTAAPVIPPPPPPKVEPKDSDGDGVDDTIDQCPGNFRATAVDARGCVLLDQLVLTGTNFEMGSATLKAEAAPTLRLVVQAMLANPGLQVEVGGHTDSVGPDALNQRLSLRRANSVKDFLVGEGIDAARLAAVGYGEAAPAESNETAEGRAANRRVAFKAISP
ncbi:MAG: OmpA family protein [Gammaproteobacteria bacterium]